MSIGPGFLIEFMFRSIGGCKPTVFEGARGLHCEPASAVAVSTCWAFGYLDCFFRWRYHEPSLRQTPSGELHSQTCAVSSTCIP